MKWQLVIVGLLASVIAAQAEIKFEPFTSKRCGFSILMPGTPKEETKKVKSGRGELDSTTFALGTLENKVHWMVTVVDYPADTPPELADKLLDGAVEGAMKNIKGKTLSEGKISLVNKYPGRQFQIEAEKIGIHRANVYLVNNRLYQIVARGPKDAVTSPDATKYFESFKLVE
jgi:hypothetical protein